MEPKLKTFLSSAQFQAEFGTERALLELLFSKEPLKSIFMLWKIENSASPDKADANYLRNVKDSDIFILLLGETLREAVLTEYNTAKESSKPIFAFLKECTRSKEMSSFIKNEIDKNVTRTIYHTPAELTTKVEDSLLNYIARLRGSEEKKLSSNELKKRYAVHEDERSLRLLVGVLNTEKADLTRDKILEALILQALTQSDGLTQNEITDFVGEITHDSSISTPDRISQSLSILEKQKKIKRLESIYCIDDYYKKQLHEIHAKIDSLNEQVFQSLFNRDKKQVNVDYDKYKSILQKTVSQIIYDTALNITETEFQGDKNPISYDSEELNRLATSSMLKVADVKENIAQWQQIVVNTLKSDDIQIVHWINNLRKAYWILATVGIDPEAVDFSLKHLRCYIVYLDSHIVIRAMVRAGGESELCTKILEVSSALDIEMRISYPIYKEVEIAFQGANQAYYAADRDVGRALALYKAVNRKSDIFEGYLTAKIAQKELTWESYINRFYSPMDRNKLKSYIENELGIAVRSEFAFDESQTRSISNVTQMLLKERGQEIEHHDEMKTGFPKDYILRENEAKQMAIIYLLRKNPERKGVQYWFITFDHYVYNVSVNLARRGDDFYSFPCYMKPARWLEIISNYSPQPLDINVFREILVTPAINYAADYIESEVITQLLKARVDLSVTQVETLRYMFTDIVNRPAVQDAYAMLCAKEEIDDLSTIGKVKDKIINALSEEIDKLKGDIETHEKAAKKAKAKERYYRKQLRRTAKTGKKKRSK